MRRALVAAGLVAALAGCGGSDAGKPAATPSPTPSPSPVTTELTSTIALYDNNAEDIANPYIGHAFKVTGSTCEGRGSFADFSPGHTADITAADGSVVATADVGTGTYLPKDGARGSVCAFRVTFTDLPLDLTLFKISLAGRGGPTFQNSDLLANQADLAFNEQS